MSVSRVTSINIYHTPQRSPKPDLNPTHLQSTIPSLNIQKSFSPTMPSFAFSPQETQTSKNMWQMKQKLQDYQQRIGLLKEYLGGCGGKNIEIGLVARIFGFQLQRNRLENQEQKVVKQLGNKVKNLIKQNNHLKNQNTNIDDVLLQNKKLHNLLQSKSHSQQSLLHKLSLQNSLLKQQLQSLSSQFNLKQSQLSKQLILNQQSYQQNSLLMKQKFFQLQNQSRKQQKQSLDQLEKTYQTKIKQNQEYFQLRLKEQQLEYENQYTQRELAYIKQTKEWQQDHTNELLHIKGQQLDNLKQYYINIISKVQQQQKKTIQKLISSLKSLDSRIIQTKKSMSHLQFQRKNSLLSTIRKSRNIASLSPKPNGQSQQQPLPDIDSPKNVFVRSSQDELLQHKVGYLEQEIRGLRDRLGAAEGVIVGKTDRIIRLERELAGKVQFDREIMAKTKVMPSASDKDYSEEVKNIKQSIISCNLSNFDIFQTQFSQIIQQRNQMNKQLSSLKKSSKQSSRISLLQKHLSKQRQKVAHLESLLRNSQSQQHNLRQQIIELKSQLQQLKINQHIIQQGQEIIAGQMADGISGLKWQGVLKECLTKAVRRLQILQQKMKKDYTMQLRDENKT